MAKTGLLQFQAPDGSIVERPQQEVQTLRRAGFKPMSGQSVSLLTSRGPQEVPVETLMTVPATADVGIEGGEQRFSRVAEERYGGVGGALKGLAYGGVQGLTSGFATPMAVKKGSKEAEDIEMLREAQPVATGVGEFGGSLAQFAGLTAATGGLGGAAAGASTLGRAAAAFGRAPAAAQVLGRAAAMGVPYGVGSEMTEATLAGREADIARGAGIGLGAGLAGEAVGGALVRAYPKVKGALSSIRTALTEAAAPAEKKVVAKTISDQLDQEAVTLGVQAQESLATHRANMESAVKSAQARAETYLQAQDALEKAARESGLPLKQADRIAKINARVRDNVEKLQGIEEKLTSQEKLISDVTTLVENAKDTKSLLDAALNQKTLATQNVRELEKQIASATKAGAAERSLAALRSKQELAQLEIEHYAALEANIRAQADNLYMVGVAKQADVDVAKAVGLAGKEAEAAAVKLAKTTEDLAKTTISQDVRTAAEETLAGARGAAEAMTPAAGAEGFMPKTKIFPSGKKTATNAFTMTDEQLSGVLRDATERNPWTAVGVIDKLLSDEGLTIGADRFASNAMAVARVLESDRSISGRIIGAARKTLRDRMTRGGPGGGRAAGNYTYARKGDFWRSKMDEVLRAGKAPAPIEAPAAAVDVAAEAVTPEVAAGAAGLPTGEQIAAMTQAQSLAAEGAAQAADEAARLGQVQNDIRSRLRFYRQAFENGAKEARVAKTQQARDRAMMRSTQASIVEDQLTQTLDQTTALRDTLAERTMAQGETALEAQQQRQALDQIKAQRRDLVEKARLSERAANLRREYGQTLDRIEEDFMRRGAITPLQEAADAARSAMVANDAKYPSLIRKFEGSRVVQDFDKAMQQRMKDFYASDEGKKIVDAIAKAEKATQRLGEAKAAEAAAEAEASVSTKDRVRDALKNPMVWATAAAGGPTAGLTALAGIVASQMPGLSMRRLMAALTPQFFMSAAENAANVLLKESAGRATARRVMATKALGAVTRPEVERAKTEVDDLIAQQEVAREVFKSSSRKILFPQEHYNQLEQQFAGAIGELQRARPATFGKGPVSAEEEAFVRAYRLITDPESLVDSMRRGSMSAAEVAVLQKVSPAAYQTVANMLQSIQENAPKAQVSPLAARFSISVRGRNAGLSVADVQGTMTQAQESQSLGTVRPGRTSSIVENAGD